MVFDKLDTAFASKNVRFLTTDSGLEEIFNVYNMDKKKTTPNERIVTRGSSAYFFSDTIREVTFESVITKDLYIYLNTNSDLGANVNLPEIPMQVKADSVSGSAPDNIQEDFTAQIWELEDFAIENTLYYWIRAKMFVKAGTTVIT